MSHSSVVTRVSEAPTSPCTSRLLNFDVNDVVLGRFLRLGHNNVEDTVLELCLHLLNLGIVRQGHTRVVAAIAARGPTILLLVLRLVLTLDHEVTIFD
jgi:hypothetical protein